MKYIYFFITLIVLSACEDVEREPVVIDTDAPGQVENVNVTPIPGGAKITYDLPDDIDLLYVQARYMLPNGKEVLTNASRNTRTLTIEGLAEVREYEIALTTVDTSGNCSEPYCLKIIPDTPPITSVFSSLKVQADFGGVNLQWDNPSEAELAVFISMKNEENEWFLLDSYYSSQKAGNYSVRGLADVESEFSVQFRDKWNNYSEARTDILTPMYEVQISAQDIVFLEHAFTFGVPASDMGRLPMMCDYRFEDNVTTNSIVPWHISFAIDKQPIKLSRVVIWQYSWPFNNYGHYYAGGNGSLYEVYGTADEIPTVDMSGWNLLATCPIVKPSGLPNNVGRENMTEEDYDLAHNKGHEFILPLDAPPVRYLRIRSLEGFGGALATFSEVQIFGSPSKE